MKTGESRTYLIERPWVSVRARQWWDSPWACSPNGPQMWTLPDRSLLGLEIEAVSGRAYGHVLTFIVYNAISPFFRRKRGWLVMIEDITPWEDRLNHAYSKNVISPEGLPFSCWLLIVSAPRTWFSPSSLHHPEWWLLLEWFKMSQAQYITA